MSCPQSLMQKLLSQPREEALKTLDVWRSNHITNKRVMGPSEAPKYDSIIYDQIFRPPQPKYRDSNKLYGRDFIKKMDLDQYRLLITNYGFVRKWFMKIEPIGDLRNNNEKKKVIMGIIRDNIAQIKPINVYGVDYLWLEEDIYNWCIKSLASKRKWDKKKIAKDSSSSGCPMVRIFMVISMF